jgi:hypothetical protein
MIARPALHLIPPISPGPPGTAPFSAVADGFLFELLKRDI